MMLAAKSLTDIAGGRQPTEAPVLNNLMKYSAQVRLMMARLDGFSRNTDTHAKRKAGIDAYHV